MPAWQQDKEALVGCNPNPSSPSHKPCSQQGTSKGADVPRLTNVCPCCTFSTLPHTDFLHLLYFAYDMEDHTAQRTNLVPWRKMLFINFHQALHLCFHHIELLIFNTLLFLLRGRYIIIISCSIVEAKAHSSIQMLDSHFLMKPHLSWYLGFSIIVGQI